MRTNHGVRILDPLAISRDRVRAALTATLALAAGGVGTANASELRGLANDGVPETCASGSADCFTLLGVSIEGARAIPNSELAEIYTPFLTRQVDMTDLARIAERITARYRARGYFLSYATVPPQPAGGVARILVHEGRIGEVVVEGDGAERIQSYLAGLQEAPIADLRDLERRLGFAGDAPGMSVRSRMEPIEGDIHRLVVTADYEARSANVFVDNRGTPAMDELRAYARVAANGVFADRDQAALAVFTAPRSPSEYTFVEASWAYAFENGAWLRASAGMSRSNDGADLLSADIGGDSEIVSLCYEFPIIRTRRAGLWLSAGFDSLHQENDWSDGSGAYADELRVVRAGIRGTLDDAGRSTTVIVQTSFGLDALGASEASPMRRSRADADARFFKIDGFASHYRDLGRHFGVYGAVSGQWSAEPLLGAEEFTAGGAVFGRAFGYGEISGDRGLAASLELRAGFDPEGALLSFAQGYAFVDAAQVWNDGGGQDLASAGAGVRLTLQDRVTAGFELARPIDRTPSEETDRDWRQFFSLSASY